MGKPVFCCSGLGLGIVLQFLAAQVWAAGFEVEVEIPRLSVAEYHKPYVALWIESEQQEITNLGVWYDLKLKNGEGTKWLKDLRQWWRKSGRDLEFPVDGMTSATRAPGKHRLIYSGKPVLKQLPPGQYRLMIEAAREVGGRELQTISFNWPPEKNQRIQAQGKHELGAITLELKP